MRIPITKIPIPCIFGIAVSLLIVIFFMGCTHNQPSQEMSSSKEISLSKEISKNQEWLKRDVVKIAAGQVNQDENKYEVMLAYIDSAGAEGADLIVLPEYIAGVFSIPLKESDPISQIAKAAQKNNIYVIVGGWEEFEEGAFKSKKKGGFSNTALLFDRRGEIAGKYSKMHPAVGKAPHWWPPLPDQSEWIMKAGEDFPVFELDFGCVGIMICYDGYFPEPAEILSLHGAEIVAWINARGGSIEKHLVQSDIQRNYIAMVATNLGHGAGTLIAQNHHQIETYVEDTGNHYISHDINMKKLRERRAHSRVHHQRRPDLYESITKEHAIWEAY
jgi:predicted amidohydrolase